MKEKIKEAVGLYYMANRVIERGAITECVSLSNQEIEANRRKALRILNKECKKQDLIEFILNDYRNI